MENQVKTSTDNKEQQLKKVIKNDDDPFASADRGTDYHLSYVQCPDEFPDDE